MIDTIDEKWREMREMVVGMEEALASGSLSNPERIPEMQTHFRFQAALLVGDAERLQATLPPEAEAFVQRYLGQPPYPTRRDIMIEMHPELKEMFKKQGE